MAREALQRLLVIGALRARPWHDGAARQCQPFIGDDECGVEKGLDAETVACGTGAVRRVEAEQPGLDLLDGESRDGAGKARGEHGAVPAIRVLGVHHAIRQTERGLEAVGEAWRDAVADDDAVHHRLDLMLDLAVQRWDFADLVQFSIHLHPGEAAALQLGQFLAVLSLAIAHHRREQQ